MDAIICPACGASNPLEAAVCDNCNEDLNTVKSVIDTANAHYNQALSLSHAGKLDEAIGQLEAALALSAQNPQYHNLLGTIYAQKGLYSEAIRAWERCIELNPETEKAYHNIEKAQDMEEDAAEEQRKRPFLLTSIAACILAVFLLFTTAYFGVRSYFKSQSITSLNNQIKNKDIEIATWKTQFEAIEKKFPQEGIDGLLKKISDLQGLADARQEQLQQANKQWQANLQNRNTEINNLTNQITELQRENKQLKTENQNINQLQAIINTHKAEIDKLKQTIEQKDIAINDAKSEAESYRIELATAERTIQTLKQERERTIENMRATHDKIVEGLRQTIRDLRDEVAQKERRIADLQFADQVLKQAVENYGNNDFEIAQALVKDALERTPNHQTALYLNEKIQTILSDPLEMELRRKAQFESERKRAEERKNLINDNRELVQTLLKEGSFDKAIEMAQRTLNLIPKESEEREPFVQVIDQAYEMKRQSVTMLLEAKRNIKEENYKQAESMLKQILRRDPKNQEAKSLMEQLVQ